MGIFLNQTINIILFFIFFLYISCTPPSNLQKHTSFLTLHRLCSKFSDFHSYACEYPISKEVGVQESFLIPIDGWEALD